MIKIQYVEALAWLDTIYIIFFLSTAVNIEMVTEQKNTKENITKNFVEE
jgi:hypothetical protein